MDIVSINEKKFEISKIKKTIVIQIDDNGNGSETTIIDPDVNLILAAIMDYCKKNEVENTGVNVSRVVLKQNKLIDPTNEETSEEIDVKKNAVISEKDTMESLRQEEETFEKNKINDNNLEIEKSVKRKHRFLSQDTNISKNYSHNISNIRQQYHVEGKTYKNEVEPKDVHQISEALQENIPSNSHDELNTESIIEITKPHEDESKNTNKILSNTDPNSPFRRIKKSNFIQRFYDLNK